jgi:hypothetical protein
VASLFEGGTEGSQAIPAANMIRSFNEGNQLHSGPP